MRVTRLGLRVGRFEEVNVRKGSWDVHPLGGKSRDEAKALTSRNGAGGAVQ